ncbi:MAG: hypothetical protein AAFQ10_10980 [Pseudomonadota bacterium]
MASVFIHEIDLSSEDRFDPGFPAGTVAQEGLTWAVGSVDPQQSYSLSPDMNGFLVSVAFNANAPIMARLGSAASAAPNGEAGAVVVLQGAERFIRAGAGDTLYLTEAA